MKKLYLLALATISMTAQTPCSSGSAGPYDCDGYDLQSRISLQDMDANRGNDSWGWTDTTTGIEYVIMALDNGTAFIDISDPTNPIYLGKLDTETNASTWRDVKVYQDHAFIVSEASGHGMQVFDLRRLRDVTSPPESFDTDAYYGGFGNAHNIIINEDSGYAYAVGTSTFNSGPHFINIQDPQNPIAAGGYASDGYSHDAQVVTYNGPDTDYTGREILLSSNADEIVILDVTNKSNPVLIEKIDYPNLEYTHQGWFTEDHRFFIVGDEIDELENGFNTRSLIFDFEDLDNPELDFEYFGPTAAIDHNGYVVGDKYYMANYTAGLRVIDISDIANGTMEEIGSFDSHPQTNGASFDGAWSVYPYFASGNIVISDITRGLFIVKDPLLGTNNITQEGFTITPNPATVSISIKSNTTPINAIEIINILGQQVMNFSFAETLNTSFDITSLNAGLYLVKINNQTTKRLIIK